jgi:hypothetical protein
MVKDGRFANLQKQQISSAGLMLLSIIIWKALTSTIYKTVVSLAEI